MALTRLQLFRALNVIPKGPRLEKRTQKAYEELEEAIWRRSVEKPATSFWATLFPIGDKACARQALYNLMNIAHPKPFGPRDRAVTEMGKAAEYQIVYRWGKAGYTIGGSFPLHYGEEIGQLALQDSDTWLSGNLDAVLDIRPDCDFVLPVDIKSKSDKSIQQMRTAALSYDPRHYAQIQAYIYLCNLVHEDMGWADMGLKPAEGGILFYVSRENPRNTFEYYFKADWDAINTAVSRLREWKTAFVFDTLPKRNDWKWSLPPCLHCNFKKHGCKPDHKEDVIQLSQSNGIEWTQSVRNYSYEDTRKKVIERWV